MTLIRETTLRLATCCVGFTQCFVLCVNLSDCTLSRPRGRTPDVVGWWRLRVHNAHVSVQVHLVSPAVARASTPTWQQPCLSDSDFSIRRLQSVCVCVYVCPRECDREGHQRRVGVYLTRRGMMRCTGMSATPRVVHRCSRRTHLLCHRSRTPNTRLHLTTAVTS